MGFVAFQAFSLFNRNVHHLFIGPGFARGMTSVTELGPVHKEEIFVVSHMRAVAGDTLLGCTWFVGNPLCQFIFQSGVTIKAYIPHISPDCRSPMGNRK